MEVKYYTPVITVFEEDGATPDWEGNRRLHRFLLEGGVDGLVLMGSTGEFYTMSLETQKEMIDFAARTLPAGTEVMVGAARMKMAETLDLCRYAASRGLDRVMLVSPYYFRLTQEDLEEYYGRIARETPCRIYLYNYPDRTGHDLTPELVERLALRFENIVGIKDTVSELGHTRAVLRAVRKERPDFAVYSGFDENLAHIALSGGNGCIGGLSNLLPDRCAAWVRAIREERMADIAAWQQYFDRAMALYDIAQPFMPAVKRALKLRGMELGEACAFPVSPATEAQEAKLAALLSELDAAEPRRF